jgi:hypothetical protein
MSETGAQNIAGKGRQNMANLANLSAIGWPGIRTIGEFILDIE